MTILCVILIVLGSLLCMAGGIWQVVAAFRRSLGWGLAVLLVPFANVVFLFYDWAASKGPFITVVTGLLLLGGSLSVSLSVQRHGGKVPWMPAAFGGVPAEPAKREPGGIADQGMFKARKDAEIQIKLVNLRTRETELLQRKAELAPNDHAGRLALAEEIKKYNADRELVAQRVKEQQPGGK